MIKSIGLLIILGVACGSILYAVNHGTRAQIETNRSLARQAVFANMLEDHAQQYTVNPYSTAQVQQEASLDCDRVIAATTVAQGYAGAMEFAYIYWPAQKHISLRNVRHQETPGFGDFIVTDWLRDRDGAELAAWQNMDRVSGATITFEALRTTVIRTLRHLDEVCLAR